jgi:hypothetical protein
MRLGSKESFDARRERPLRSSFALLFAVSLTVASSVLFGLPSRAEAVPTPWINCGTPSDELQITKSDASVWPPQRGQSETLVIAGLLATPLSNIHQDLLLNLNGTQLFPISGNEIIPTISAGPFTETITFTVPTWIPAGTVVRIQYEVGDRVTHKAVLCVKATIPFK